MRRTPEHDRPAVAGERRRLLLVGAGHTHLFLLARSADLVAEGYDIALIAPEEFAYSGVATATAVGTLSRAAGTVDVARLVAELPVQHHPGTLADLDVATGIAITAAGASVAFDVVSFNIGSVVDLEDVAVDPSVIKVKPLADLGTLDGRLTALGSGAAVTVIGAGSSGIELAAQIRLRPEVDAVRLLEAGPEIAPGLPQGARRRVARLLGRRGIEVRLDATVVRISSDRVVLRDGSEIAHDLVVLATGLSAPAVLTELGLGDRDGIPVLGTLVHPDHPQVYAVGDCAWFLPHPLPRVGVHGVRQGPVLLASLLARAQGAALPVYEPQRRVLSILDLGGGHGLSVWGRFWMLGRVSLKLKRLIDRRWLRRYQTTRRGA